MVDQTVAVFGRLDAAFNNAGTMTVNIETADASGDEFDRVAAVNLRGVWNCMKHELRHMRTQGSGAIVNSGHQPGTGDDRVHRLRLGRNRLGWK